MAVIQKTLTLVPAPEDEENPYEIYTTGINTTHPRYFLAFTDSNKVKRWMEIDKALFDAFNEFELDDLLFSTKWTGTMSDPK